MITSSATTHFDRSGKGRGHPIAARARHWARPTPALFGVLLALATLDAPSVRRDERGQGTVEYALILLAAAAVALAVVAWVARPDLIGRLFDTVVGRVLNQAG